MLRSSESIAAMALESMGFRVVQLHRKVSIDGVDVSDIDIVAEKDGQDYAVEVKAGYIDVSAIRQAYVNSVLTGMKPLVIARGFSDEGAKLLAQRLGVEVIVLPDLLYSKPDELRELVKDAVEEALARLLEPLSSCGSLGPEDVKVLEALASARDFAEAAQALGTTPDGLVRIVESMRQRGLLPRGSFRALRAAAMILLFCERASPRQERMGNAKAKP